MKKLFRTMLCAAMAAAALCVSAFAADTVPAKQGDFYVEVNGEYVTFTDAVPQLKNDRSCLPFVAVFEQLGFAEKDMTWDGATGTVTATKPDVAYTPFGGGDARRGAVTVRLTIGSNTFSVWYEGDTTAAPMVGQAQVVRDFTSEAAPYIDPATSRTYIPFGLVADALGYNVGWDAQMGTVIIDDVDAILAENEAAYTMMDKYMAYSRSFSQKNQKVDGSYTAVLEAAAQEGSDQTQMLMTMDGDYTMTVQGSKQAQFTTRMAVDMLMTVNGQQTDTGMEDALPMLVNMEMRMDMDQGTLYFQSPELANMMGQEGMANAWFKLDMKTMMDAMTPQTGMDYAQMMGMVMGVQDKSFEDLLAMALKSAPLTDASMTTKDTLELVNALCADSAFKKSGTDYVSTVDLGDMGQVTLTLYTSGSKVNGYAMKMAAGAQDMEMALTMQMKDNKLLAEMGMKMGGTVSMTMSMDGTYQATNSKPVTELPAGAVVVDLLQLAAGSAR